MRPLADRLPVTARTPDLAGHGVSYADPGDYSIDAMADRVLELSDEPVDLVGYSMGGRVALAAACRSPQKVRSLSLIGASAGLSDPTARAQRRDDDEQLAQRLETDFAGFVDSWMDSPLFASQRQLGVAAYAKARRQRLRHDPSELARSLRFAGTGVMTPLLDQLDRCVMPVSLIVGEHDDKFRAIADDLVVRLPNATVYVISGAGHAAHLERLDAVAEAVMATIGRR